MGILTQIKVVMDFFKFAQGQSLPPGSLFLIPTPIGNLADITIRALYILQQVDGIACEDKRHSGSLLSSYGISKPLFAIHEHNEITASAHVIERLQKGERWAYISDAGTPGISDPGAILANEVKKANFPVIPLPGANAITTTISGAGDFLKSTAGQFQFLGFLPNKATQRDESIRHALSSNVASFFYEAPHRIEGTMKAIANLIADDQRVLVAKELTKIYESISIIKGSELGSWINQVTSWQGEFVVGIEGRPKKEKASEIDELTLKWISELEGTIGHKDLSEIISRVTSMPKKDAYKALLELRK
jgi:16S rRNA (cytidine1402-2'-O)-methyltransferase